ETVLHQYLINCKIISTSGVITERGEAVLIFQGLEVLRFTDSLLHVKVVEELRNGNEVPPTVNEITFKKVHPKDTTAKALQNLWTLTHSSDPLTPPFQIKFLADGSYQLLLADNPDEAEEGTYEVFGSFLMIEFEQSSIFGNSNKQDVACWDILFAREKEKETTMTWRAMVERGGERFMHSLDFTLVVQK
ncbi:MAG: hypothetical protein LBC84_08590, partial [Prevotellaceae bacterium]|nr:hypothetical protein [Prevotellaceae bacterium]